MCNIYLYFTNMLCIQMNSRNAISIIFQFRLNLLYENFKLVTMWIRLVLICMRVLFYFFIHNNKEFCTSLFKVGNR